MTEEGLVERLHAHRLLRLHAALAHRNRCDGVTSKGVDELLVVDLPVAVVVADGDQLSELGIIHRNVPHIQRAGELLLVHRARAVHVDVLECLEHVAEAAVQRLRSHRSELALGLGLLEKRRLDRHRPWRCCVEVVTHRGRAAILMLSLRPHTR